jgi:hypothetical protein
MPVELSIGVWIETAQKDSFPLNLQMWVTASGLSRQLAGFHFPLQRKPPALPRAFENIHRERAKPAIEASLARFGITILVRAFAFRARRARPDSPANWSTVASYLKGTSDRTIRCGRWVTLTECNYFSTVTSRLTP